MSSISLHLAPWTVDDVTKLTDQTLVAGEDMKKAVRRCRTFLDNYLQHNDRPIYGINTGFGSLCQTRISNAELEQLQVNLVRSHACGTGMAIEPELVRTMLLLKVKSLGQGYSGVHEDTVNLLLDLFNHRITPVVYEYGSLGASGDLAPLAHMSLPLIGEGEVWWNGAICPAAEVMQEKGIQPVTLRSKEGLALLNGTQFMQAHGVWTLHRATRLLNWAHFLGSAALVAFDGLTEPFHPRLHEIRGHRGAIETAATVREWLAGYEPAEGASHVQDPYSLRCIPQVHGAVADALQHVKQVVETEINAVTDNPTLLPEEGEIVSGGNFHGEPLALTFDYLKIAMAELGSISERRTFKLVSGQRGLPAFLTPKPGMNSGLMIPQYTAASLVSSNKQLATPASVDTIDSSNGQEDHVSMGANAARQLWKTVNNVEQILAIEWLNVFQALHLRNQNGGSIPGRIQNVYNTFSQDIRPISNDRRLYEDMRIATSFLAKHMPQDHLID